MSMTFAQIVTLATQMAKVPGFTSQAGQLFNAILEELSQTYDFDVAHGFYHFNFNTSLQPATNSPVIAGSGPYQLPSDYLRADRDDVFWTLQGVPYPLVCIDLSEFDRTVQQAGLQTYPYWYCTDLSTSPPGMYVYPPPSGNYDVYVRYRRQMADVTAPETNTGTPWFPLPTYLYTRLAGELMKISDDERWRVFLGEGPEGAQGILNRYLKLKDDPENRSKRVTLDKRRFSGNFSSLSNTKTVGW